jgi:hypothetical protein
MYRKGKEIRKKKYLAAFVFVHSVLGRSFIQYMNFEMKQIESAETSCWEVERK